MPLQRHLFATEIAAQLKPHRVGDDFDRRARGYRDSRVAGRNVSCERLDIHMTIEREPRPFGIDHAQPVPVEPNLVRTGGQVDTDGTPRRRRICNHADTVSVDEPLALLYSQVRFRLECQGPLATRRRRRRWPRLTNLGAYFPVN